MYNSKYFLLCFAILMLGSPAFGFGDVSRNGGDAFICGERDPSAKEKQPPAGVYTADYVATFDNHEFLEFKTLNDALDAVEKLLPTAYRLDFANYRSWLFKDRLHKNQMHVWKSSPRPLTPLNDEALSFQPPANCIEAKDKIRKIDYSFAPGLYQLVERTTSPAGHITYSVTTLLFSKIAAKVLQLAMIVTHEWLWKYVGNANDLRAVNAWLFAKSRSDYDPLTNETSTIMFARNADEFFTFAEPYFVNKLDPIPESASPPTEQRVAVNEAAFVAGKVSFTNAPELQKAMAELETAKQLRQQFRRNELPSDRGVGAMASARRTFQAICGLWKKRRKDAGFAANKDYSALVEKVDRDLLVGLDGNIFPLIHYPKDEYLQSLSYAAGVGNIIQGFINADEAFEAWEKLEMKAAGIPDVLIPTETTTTGAVSDPNFLKAKAQLAEARVLVEKYNVEKIPADRGVLVMANAVKNFEAISDLWRQHRKNEVFTTNAGYAGLVDRVNDRLFGYSALEGKISALKKYPDLNDVEPEDYMEGIAHIEQGINYVIMALKDWEKLELSIAITAEEPPDQPNFFLLEQGLGATIAP